MDIDDKEFYCKWTYDFFSIHVKILQNINIQIINIINIMYSIVNKQNYLNNIDYPFHMKPEEHHRYGISGFCLRHP